ncbi:MAG: AmmeMemoRadiSam system protein A [Coriobacteriaceae bacterium]|nr:AmmeMemoRadiSam system protein A [Coriobacteriaceae bacterium]
MTDEVLGIIAPHPPIMVPQVGGGRAAVTSASADALAVAARMLERFAPETLVVMSPHSPMAHDAFLIDTAEHSAGSLGQFGAPEVRMELRTDAALASELLDRLDAAGIPAADRASAPLFESGLLDHGVLVPLSFLAPRGGWPVVGISLSILSLQTHRELGRHVREAAAALGRRVAFVASGDCSHRLTHDGPYPYSPQGPLLDAALRERVAAGDFEGLMHLDPGMVEEGGECGLRSFITLGGFLGQDPETRVLAYEGPWGVGYLTAVAGSPGLLSALDDTPVRGSKGGGPGDAEAELPALARRAIEEHVRRGTVIEAPDLDDPGLPDRAGVFVSLHRAGELRGCIGTICPTRPTLAGEVVANALEAAMHDPRFSPLGVDELDGLDVKVDILHAAERCDFADLDPARYGVIVSCDLRRGLLLPDLEGVETPDQQVTIALRKAGIGPDERFAIERFKVDRHA